MAMEKVLILNPGEMGAAVGNAFHQNGFTVMATLAGRSEATRKRAEAAGFVDAGTLEQAVAEADVIFSILPPASAVNMANAVAAAMKSTGATPPYADCNAVSPDTAKQIAAVIENAGASAIDGGIVGNPPGGSPKATRFFVSGRDAMLMNEFDGKGIDVRQCGVTIGQGSAVKMIYAGVTKGVSALCANMLIAAELLDVADTVHEEFEYSQENLYKRMHALTPSLPATADRYIGEMEEIAATMRAIGLTDGFHEGSADLYRLLDKSPFADEIRETVDRTRGLRDTIKGCASVVK